MQNVTMQMLTKKQWKATMLAAEISWDIGSPKGFHRKYFGSRLQAHYNYFLQGFESKEQLIELLKLLQLY